MPSGTYLRSSACGVLWLLTGWCLSCAPPEEGEDQGSRPRSPNPNPVFFSELIHVPPTQDTIFLSYLRVCRVPAWEALLEEGVIRDVSLFELEEVEASLKEAQTWDFLLLFEAVPGTESERVFGTTHVPGACPGFINPTHTVLRIEALATTPNSYFPEPHPMHRSRSTEIPYLIEFIGVEDTPEALATYRRLMETYFGPENGALVEEGKLYNLIALETTEVLFQAPGVSSWNQLHVSGDLPEYMELDWDSVYAELHQRLFSVDLDSTWRQMPPIIERPGNYKGRLLEEFWDQ